METETSGPRLLADIGGTRARFALQHPGGAAQSVRIYDAADYPDLATLCHAYLQHAAPETAPRHGAFAVASPVQGDMVEMTNRDWSFSTAALKRTLGLDSLHIVNDFAAAALAIPQLGADDLSKIGGGGAASGGTIALIGPGTGLGVAGLVAQADGGWRVLATEGGHVTLAAADAQEAAAIDRLRARFGHVSAERVLSGPGLANLYDALAPGPGRDGGAAGRIAPEDITRRALAGDDPPCQAALSMFCAMLGTVAGNLALSLGASGGVYIAGGIVPALGPAFAASKFRARFEDKGRFRAYMEAIPTWVITAETPAFAGLAALLDRK